MILRTVAALTCSYAFLLGSAIAQEVVDWTGFYAGISAGYGVDRTQEDSTKSTIGPLETNPGEFESQTQANSVGRIESLIGGVGVGYNIQHNQFVLGVDGDVNFGGLDRTNSDVSNIFATDGVDTISIDNGTYTQFDIDWYSTFSGRAGVSFDGWLAYVKGGLAVANVSSDSTSTTTIASSDPNILPPGTATASASSSKLVFGPIIGAGFEKMVTSKISIGVEYNFVGLPDVSVPEASTLGALGGGTDSESVFQSSIHTVKATLKYHF